MGFLDGAKRLLNIGAGKADRMVENAEKNDPEAVLRAACDEMRGEISDLDEAARNLKGIQFKKNEEIEQHNAKIKELDEMIQHAIDSDNDEMGVTLMTQKEDVEAEIEGLNEEVAFAKEEGDAIVSLLESRKKDLKQLESDQARATSLKDTADIIKKIDDRKAGVANDSTSRAVKNAQDGLASARASISASKDIKAQSAEGKLDSFKADKAKSDAAAKFAALKNAK